MKEISVSGNKGVLSAEYREQRLETILDNTQSSELGIREEVEERVRIFLWSDENISQRFPPL